MAEIEQNQELKQSIIIFEGQVLKKELNHISREEYTYMQDMYNQTDMYGLRQFMTNKFKYTDY